MNLEKIFSGSIGLNGWGIAGLVVMVAGALASVFSRRIAPQRENLVKILGLLACGIGAALVIAIGK